MVCTRVPVSLVMGTLIVFEKGAIMYHMTIRKGTLGVHHHNGFNKTYSLDTREIPLGFEVLQLCFMFLNSRGKKQNVAISPVTFLQRPMAKDHLMELGE